MTSPFCVKAVLLGILLTIMAYVHYMYTLVGCARELTHWALWLTTLQIAISFKCSLDTEIESKKGWLAAHHILFEIVTPMNLLVTTVYWSMLR